MLRNKLKNWKREPIHKKWQNYKKKAAAYKQEGHTIKQLREAFGIPSETYYQ
jgi:hypothetical protein